MARNVRGGVDQRQLSRISLSSAASKIDRRQSAFALECFRSASLIRENQGERLRSRLSIYGIKEFVNIMSVYVAG
jgi:hypothetical protein